VQFPSTHFQHPPTSFFTYALFCFVRFRDNVTATERRSVFCRMTRQQATRQTMRGSVPDRDFFQTVSTMQTAILSPG